MEDRVVVGVLGGLEAKSNGWMQFSIQEAGKQYPVKASTKKPELIQQCTALLGQTVKVRIGEQPSTNINPNTGQPYVNRYLNEVAVAAPGETSSSTPQAQAQGQAQQQQASSDSVRELRIMRQTAAKVVGEMYASLPPEQQTPQGMVAAAEVWMAYFVYGAPRFGVQAFDTTTTGATPVTDAVAPQPEQTPQEEQQALPVGANGAVCDQCGYSAPHHAAGCPNEFAGL